MRRDPFRLFDFPCRPFVVFGANFVGVHGLDDLMQVEDEIEARHLDLWSCVVSLDTKQTFA